jgi:hypothetical protein
VSGGLKSVTVSPAVIVGGQPAKGSVNLSPPFEADVVAVLRSDRPDVLKVPEEVAVPAGRSRVSFRVETPQLPPGQAVTATLTARIEDQVVTHPVTVQGGRG